jgi:hypothetical protein
LSGFITISAVDKNIFICLSIAYEFGTAIDAVNDLNTYTFHINLYDLVFLGTIFIGVAFALLLGFTKRNNQTANRFLALALATIVWRLVWVKAQNKGMEAVMLNNAPASGGNGIGLSPDQIYLQPDKKKK